jgi:hypothetical protein
MTYLDFATVKNTLNTELKNFLSLMSLFDSMKEYKGEITQSHEFQFMGDTLINVNISANQKKLLINITHENETMMDVEMSYSDDEMDFVVNNEFILSNVPCSSSDSWRLFDLLGEITASLEQDLMVEVDL